MSIRKRTVAIAVLATVALGVSLAANAPAKAQVVFESIYAQPANMVDGIDVGTRESSTADHASASVAAEQRCPAGARCERGHGGHS